MAAKRTPARSRGRRAPPRRKTARRKRVARLAVRSTRTRRVVGTRRRTIAARRNARTKVRTARRLTRSAVVRRRKRSKPSLERRHAVKGVLKVQELTKTGTSLRLKVYAEGEKIGDLEIGRGSLFWRGGKRHKMKRLNWSRFAELMDELAYED